MHIKTLPNGFIHQKLSIDRSNFKVCQVLFEKNNWRRPMTKYRYAVLRRKVYTIFSCFGPNYAKFSVSIISAHRCRRN